MAETMNRKVKTVIGAGSVVSPEDLNVREWTQVLTVAYRELTLDYLRGLESLHQILNKVGGEDRCGTVCPPDVLQSVAVRENALFLDCGVLRGFSRYKSERREIRILLARTRETEPTFFLLTSNWEEERWERKDKWDHGVKLVATEALLQPTTLPEILELDNTASCASRILNAFADSQEYTAAGLEKKLRTARARAVILQGYVIRLNCRYYHPRSLSV